MGVPSHLVIHPILLPTPFLDISRSLPLPPGTPITLLPYGTPAFFLACYTGPTTGLTKQFRLSLQGMGAGEWENPCRIPFTSNMDTSISDNAHQNSTFIIGWIKVENKQGEDKGITIIYPTSLCLSYIPFSTPRTPLDYIPELPAPLQPSPQVSIIMPSVSAVTQSGPPPIANSTGTFTPLHPHRPSFLTSPTSESLHSFRSLTLSKSRDFRQVATEVGGYVDAVARERERERERLKREREGGPSLSPNLARTTVTTPASVPTPMAATTISAPVSLATQVTSVNAGSTSQQHLQPPMPVQNFYPSPPQLNPIVVPTSGEKSSPVVDSTATAPVLAPPLPIISTTSGSNGYDPFGPMETTWSQPAQNYLGMDMDMDFGMDDMGMNFGLNMASVTNNSTSRTAYNDSRGNMEFEDALTDDDFSFFDRPSRAAAVATPSTFTQSRIASGSGTHPLSVSSLPAGAAMSPPLFGDMNLSGPGPLNHSHSSHNQQMWTPGGFMEGFTPRSVDHNDSIPPDLLPSSPGQTPDTHSAPATPNVHLEYDTAIKRSSTSDLFEPIPFARYHRAIDGKYAFGKFALPSPPAEGVFAESVSISSPSSRNGHSSWRCQYDAITDPRIGVVRKLIGVKRKTNFQHEIRSPPRRSSWVEEWEKPVSEKDDGPGVKSDLESDDDEDLDDVDSPLMSRPTTPAPAYLPLGPTLLHTQFQHSQLLPLSTSLRPPGAAVAPINLIATNLTISVPTPVSPAATMGQASEKSKSLEAAAFAVAAEVVENPIWAETWRANIVGAKPTPAVWSTDIMAVSELLEAVPSLEAPVDIISLFGLGKLTFGSSQNIIDPLHFRYF
jgi:mediator of RNA polymerase II transcription subunit 13, fungi type